MAVDVGAHDLDRIRRATLVVASPGVPPDAPPLAAAREAGIQIVGEIEVALRAVPDLRYVGITGTNGKTTTTGLVAHLFRALGLDATAGGNIGTPLAEIATRDRPPDWIALELSSFQLHDSPSIAPTVGVLTNLAADHLDRYATVEDYYADKRRLFANAAPHSRWVVNADDPAVMEMAAAADGTAYTFSLERDDGAARYDRASRTLFLLGEPLLGRDELPLIGDHNVANALAAVLAVAVADEAYQTQASRECIAEGLRTFAALPHRLELAGTYRGVRWINDSKATNVSSTLVAIEGMTGPTIVLLGGRHKGEPYTRLAEPLRRVGKRVLAYGEAAPIVEQDLGALVPVERLGSDFEVVIARARELAEPGDTVLLSPACSSYDMFQNYEQRGAVFKRLAVPEEEEKAS
jgi:UDP-N-acetylmuramoylalanine--D-glutamate ligase